MGESEAEGHGEAGGPRPGARTVLGSGAIEVAMPFTREALQDDGFVRADLIFTGVRHDEDSYEVRVFLNNPDADDTTPRTPEAGYAGRFIVFGHGGCFGGEGHCRGAQRPPDPIPALAGRQRGDPTAGQTKFITVTEPLRRLMEAGEDLRSVTLVPILSMPLPEEERMAPEVFGFRRLRLETYR